MRQSQWQASLEFMQGQLEVCNAHTVILPCNGLINPLTCSAHAVEGSPV